MAGAILRACVAAWVVVAGAGAPDGAARLANYEKDSPLTHEFRRAGAVAATLRDAARYSSVAAERVAVSNGEPPSLWCFVVGSYRTFLTTRRSLRAFLERSQPDGRWAVAVATWTEVEAANASKWRYGESKAFAAHDVRAALGGARDVAGRLADDSVQETPRKPGVFELWRPLSRSNSSRFGSLLDR